MAKSEFKPTCLDKKAGTYSYRGKTIQRVLVKQEWTSGRIDIRKKPAWTIGTDWHRWDSLVEACGWIDREFHEQREKRTHLKLVR
jgi:hypothetical protein